MNEHDYDSGINYAVVPQKCRCGFCKRCCVARGLRVRDCLAAVLKEHFQNVMMLTFTLDPEHFSEGPEPAYRWVAQERILANVMRALRKAGLVTNPRYFYVVEFHDNGWPHWHLLLDAKFLSIAKVREFWNRHLKKLGICEKDTRVGLGGVKFSSGKKSGGELEFASPIQAASYTAGYLTKFPKDGFPDWVMNYQGRIKRYGVSHHFWEGCEAPSGAGSEKSARVVEAVDEGCDPVEREVVATPSERVASCCARVGVVESGRAWSYVDCSFHRFHRFMGSLPVADALDVLGVETWDGSPLEIDREWANILASESRRLRDVATVVRVNRCRPVVGAPVESGVTEAQRALDREADRLRCSRDNLLLF